MTAQEVRLGGPSACAVGGTEPPLLRFDLCWRAVVTAVTVIGHLLDDKRGRVCLMWVNEAGLEDRYP